MENFVRMKFYQRLIILAIIGSLCVICLIIMYNVPYIYVTFIKNETGIVLKSDGRDLPSFKMSNCFNPPCLIIHQSYIGYAIPSVVKDYIKSCLRINSNYEYWFWTDIDNRILVEQYHPELLEVYDGFKNNVCRADMARIIYLETFGGVYIDMDVECLKPFDALISQSDCTFGQEPLKHILVAKIIPFPLVSNFFMACRKGHLFLAMILANLKKVAVSNNETKVIFQTGPVAITRVYNYVKKLHPELLPEIHNHTVFGQTTVHVKKIKKLCLDKNQMMRVSNDKLKDVSMRDILHECRKHVFQNNYDWRYIYMSHHFTNLWSDGWHLKENTSLLTNVISEFTGEKERKTQMKLK